MTPKDLVKHYFPSATDKEAVDILWTCTGFPGFFAGDPVKSLNQQLHQISRRSNRDPQKALYLADRDMDDQMRKLRKRSRRFGPYRGLTGEAELNDGLWHGEVEAKDVVTFQGKTKREVDQAFRDSVDDYLNFCGA